MKYLSENNDCVKFIFKNINLSSTYHTEFL